MPEAPITQKITVVLPLEDMRQFQHLVVGLRTKNRFHVSPDTERFVTNLIEYARRSKTVQLTPDTPFWRARLHDVLAKEILALEQLGAPPAHLAGHGRLNPRGIPYLYLASDELTAVSEVRPWKHAELTLAEFRVTRPISVVNFTSQDQFAQPAQPGMAGADFTWRELITWLFSAPFDPRDDTAYVPTQYLAERVKASEFDGIIYDSALHEGGYNVALFDPTLAVAQGRKKARVSSVSVAATIDPVTAAQPFARGDPHRLRG